MIKTYVILSLFHTYALSTVLVFIDQKNHGFRISSKFVVIKLVQVVNGEEP